MSIEQDLTPILEPYNVEVLFGQNAVQDFACYNKDIQNKILALIIDRAKKGPLMRPDGLDEALSGDLIGFAKIKPKKLGIRIIYRPTNLGKVLMEIIAIGPRDKKKVYKMAAERIVEFKQEMESSR